jgi:hypothetical protein
MIPRTFPSIIEAFQTKMVVYVLPSVSGLTAWIDYIPVKGVVTEDPVLANTYANAGYQVVKSQESLTGQAWLDYIPVYEDASYNKPWSTDAGGYIPVGGLFSPASLFAAGEQGWWYDPSDINRYMQTGPELVANGDFSSGTTGWNAGFGALTSTFTASAGIATITATGVDTLPRYVTAVPGCVVGKFYKVSFTEAGATNTGQDQYCVWTSGSNGTGGVTLNQVTPTLWTNDTLTYYLQATATTMYFAFGLASATNGDSASIDNISVQELTAIDTATLFQDSAGTTPVTAMEQPVGLQLDLSKGLVLGPELVTNGDFSAGTTGWTAISGIWTVSGGRLKAANTDGIKRYAQSSSTMVAGRWYKITWSQYAGAGTGAANWTIPGVWSGTDNFANSGNYINGEGDKTVYFLAPVSGQFYLYNFEQEVEYDNISVRELPGNHRFQTTSANRPVVSARVNLLTKTEQFDDAAWGLFNSATKTGTNVAIAPDGTTTADSIRVASAADSQVFQVVTTVAATYNLTCYVKRNTASNQTFRLKGTTATGSSVFSANLTATDTWQQFTLAVVVTASHAGNISISADSSGNTADLLVWGADLRVTNQGVNLPAYQRVNTSTDYDSTGFPVYIKPNGSNQFMQTNSINFTATDKMTVWQGVRKLSDAAAGIIAELSATFDSAQGVFSLAASASSSPRNDYASSIRGGAPTATNGRIATVFIAPITNTITLQYDFAQVAAVDENLVKVNGVVPTLSTPGSAAGAGNFGNYPAYFYTRAGTSIFFNGNDYGSIARGAASTAAQIANGEAYINKLTKAFA